MTSLIQINNFIIEKLNFDILADALNAEKDLAKHDALLSQARQNFDKLNQKYLAVQAEILKKAANCNQKPQQPAQQPGGVSTPCPPTTPCPPAHLARIAPSGAAPISANMVPQTVHLMPQTAVKSAGANVASQQVAAPMCRKNTSKSFLVQLLGG